MADNQICSASGWFEVKDEKAFLAFCSDNGIPIDTREDPGKFRYVHACEGLERRMEIKEGEDEGAEYETDVALMIAPFIADDWTVIFIEHEREGEGYFSMKAISVTNKTEIFDDEVELFHSDSLLGNHIRTINFQLNQQITMPYDLR
jgi:hypothetical protein